MQDSQECFARSCRGILFFDFFSLDIEGAELGAVLAIDFDLVSFGVIFVEADEHNEMKNMAIKDAPGKEWIRSLRMQRILIGLSI